MTDVCRLIQMACQTQCSPSCRAHGLCSHPSPVGLFQELLHRAPDRTSKEKNESREGEESRGQRWHKTPRGSQGENNLIKWEKTECKGESESLVSDWGTAAVSSFDPSCWISSAEETHWFSRPLTTQHRQLVVADIRWQGFLTATTHSHSSYNTINTTAVLQKYPYWWRRLRGFKGKLANNSCKRELTTQIVTYFSSSLSSAIAS